MSFDVNGYALASEEGHRLWFLDTVMTVKAGGEQTAGAFTFLEWSAPTGFGPPRHVHHRETEVFYLLEGTIVVECGERRWTAGPGAYVHLPPGIPHAFVVTDGPVRGLQVTSPAGFENYIEELGRAPERPGLPDPTEPDIARILEASSRYEVEIVGPPTTAGD